MPLTATQQPDYALPAAPHWAVGFGDLCNSDARAMRRKSCGFFYALRFFNHFPDIRKMVSIMVGGVLGGRKACRLQSPVRQPDTSSAALSLATLVGGINSNTTLEYAMNTQSQGTTAPHHKTSLTPFFSCESGQSLLFSVNPDLPMDDALNHASCILAAALATSRATAEELEKEELWGIVYLLEMSKAIVDSLY